jgi:molybdopterin-guanine dinucleotide biosynthesis protein A
MNQKSIKLLIGENEFIYSNDRIMMGVVLCGGQSLRMGADKGLLQQQSLTWAELAAQKLTDVSSVVILSVNERQCKLYSTKFDGIPMIQDDGSLQVYGPLRGILSVHLRQPSEDLLVLACDMQAMQKPVIDYLIKISSGKKEDAFVFRNAKYTEPLCAVYTSAGLKKIYNQYRQGQLVKHSLYYVLETIDTCYLNIPEEWEEYFYNYNSPYDLDNLE